MLSLQEFGSFIERFLSGFRFYRTAVYTNSIDVSFHSNKNITFGRNIYWQRRFISWLLVKQLPISIPEPRVNKKLSSKLSFSNRQRTKPS